MTDKASVDALIEKLEAENVDAEATGSSEDYAYNRAVHDCMNVVRQHFAEQAIMGASGDGCTVSTGGFDSQAPTTTTAQGEVERVKQAIASVFVPDGVWNIEEGRKLERAAKAALAAMQPAPVVDAQTLMDIVVRAMSDAGNKHGWEMGAMAKQVCDEIRPYLAQSVKKNDEY